MGGHIPDLATLRSWAHSLGPAAPVALVALMTVQQLLPLFPGSILLALSGALFGFPLGLLVAVMGTLCSSAACHTVGRGPARMLVHRFAGEARMRGIEERLKNHGIPTIAVIRAFPFVPSYAVSYAAGVVRLPLRDYVIGSVIGTLPGNVLHVLLGDRITNPRDPIFWAAMVGLVALSGLAFWIERRYRGGRAETEEADA